MGEEKGQAKLDEKADALAAEGLPAKPTKFETDKEKLRKIIRKALDKAGSFDEFSSLLLQQGVIVKESPWTVFLPDSGQDEAHHGTEAG